jgi:hypothetical protein
VPVICAALIARGWRPPAPISMYAPQVDVLGPPGGMVFPIRAEEIGKRIKAEVGNRTGTILTLGPTVLVSCRWPANLPGTRPPVRLAGAAPTSFSADQRSGEHIPLLPEDLASENEQRHRLQEFGPESRRLRKKLHWWNYFAQKITNTVQQTSRKKRLLWLPARENTGPYNQVGIGWYIPRIALVQPRIALVQPRSRWYNPGSRWYNPGSRWYNPGSRWYSPGSRWYNPGSRWYNPGSRWYSPGSSWYNPDRVVSYSPLAPCRRVTTEVPGQPSPCNLRRHPFLGYSFFLDR